MFQQRGQNGSSIIILKAQRRFDAVCKNIRLASGRLDMESASNNISQPAHTTEKRLVQTESHPLFPLVEEIVLLKYEQNIKKLYFCKLINNGSVNDNYVKLK